MEQQEQSTTPQKGIVLPLEALSIRQEQDKRKLLDAYSEFWRNSAFSKGYSSPACCREDIDSLLDEAADTVVRIRSEMPQEEEAMPLNIPEGTALEMLWQLPCHPKADPQAFVHDLVHSTLCRGQSQYQSGLTAELVDARIADISERRRVGPTSLQTIVAARESLQSALKSLLEAERSLEGQTPGEPQCDVADSPRLRGAARRVSDRAKALEEDARRLVALVAQHRAAREAAATAIQDAKVTEAKETEEPFVVAAEKAKETAAAESMAVEEKPVEEKPQEAQKTEEPMAVDQKPEALKQADDMAVEEKHVEALQQVSAEKSEASPKPAEEPMVVEKPAEETQKPAEPMVVEEKPADATEQLTVVKATKTVPEEEGMAVEDKPTVPAGDEQLVVKDQQTEAVDQEQEKQANDGTVLQIKRISEDVGKLKDTIHAFRQSTELIDLEALARNPADGARQLERLQRRCRELSEYLMRGLLDLDAVPAQDTDARALRKAQVIEIQSLMEAMDHITERIGALRADLQAQADREREEQLKQWLERRRTLPWARLRLEPRFEADRDRRTGSYVLAAALPNLRRDSIKVEVSPDGSSLNVEGIREPTEAELDALERIVEERPALRRLDRSAALLQAGAGRFGKFRRQFQIPEEVDPEGISGTYADGVLKVVLPRAVPTMPMFGSASPYRPAPNFYGDSDLWW